MKLTPNNASLCLQKRLVAIFRLLLHYTAFILLDTIQKIKTWKKILSIILSSDEQTKSPKLTIKIWTCRERLYSAWVSGGPIFWPTANILSNFYRTYYLATRSQYIVIWKFLAFCTWPKCNDLWSTNKLLKTAHQAQTRYHFYNSFGWSHINKRKFRQKFQYIVLQFLFCFLKSL